MNGIIAGVASGLGSALQNVGQQSQQLMDRESLLGMQNDLELNKDKAIADYQNQLGLTTQANERARTQQEIQNAGPNAKPADVLAQTGDVGTATAMQNMNTKEAEAQAKLSMVNNALEKLQLQGKLTQAEAEKYQAQLQYGSKEVGKDAFGNPILIDKATGGVTPLSGTNGAGNIGDPNLHGEDYLKSLSPNIAGQVKAISEGRQAMPSGFAMKSPMGQQLLAAVSQYDPSFDTVNVGARSATRKDFVGGKSADNVTALNTAIAHIGRLANNFSALNNGNYSALNYLENTAGNALNLGNTQENYTRVAADSEAVSHELAKVFRSSGMSEGEINAWKAKLSPNLAPNQQKAVIGEALDLMNGRLEALATRYNTGMGTTKQGIELLTPQSQKILSNLQGFVGEDSGLENQSRIGATPTSSQNPSQQNSATIPDYSHLWNQ